MQKKKVVVIGGGNGSAISIVALKQNLELFDISAVVSMSDSGGSSGRLREEFDTLPPGDIMRAVLAMSKYDYPLLKQIFYRNRFSGVGKLDKHNLGNLFLVLGEKFAGDYLASLRALTQSVEAIGRVYPATLDKTDLCVELDNGQVVKKESAIDKPNYDLSLGIKRAWLEPTGRIYSEAAVAIKEADYIIFGPGSFYTSIVAAILPEGMKEAINESKAKLIFAVGNACTADGETCPRSLSGTVFALEKYLPRRLDMVIFNSHKLDERQQELYKKKKWILLADDAENLAGVQVVREDYEREEGGLCSKKLGKIFKKILI